MTQLTGKDLSAIITCVSMIEAGPWDTASYGNRPDLENALAKLCAMRGKKIVALTRAELRLLNRGLSAGIMDDGIENIGLTRGEQKKLARIGNGLLDAAKSTAPRYCD